MQWAAITIVGHRLTAYCLPQGRGIMTGILLSQGNDDRATRIFLDNLAQWAQGKPLQNEV